MARWIMIGPCFTFSLSMYARSNRSGRLKSSCTANATRPMASRILMSTLGP